MPSAAMTAQIARIERTKSGKPIALVLGASVIGLAFARSLAAKGGAVFLLDSRPFEPGMRSRCATPISMPGIVDEPEKWVETLLEIGGRLAVKPVLIPTGDPHVQLLSAYNEPLSQRCRFVVPDVKTAELGCDKKLQHQFLESRGVALPQAWFPENEDDVLRIAAQGLRFPCVVKPQVSHLWRRHGSKVKLCPAANVGELIQAYRFMARTGESVLIQEEIPGGDTELHGFIGYLDRRSNPLASFTKQKLRQHPPRYGNGSLQISTRNPVIAAISIRILKDLCYTGLVGIEFKWDRRDHQFKLIEINPRCVSGVQLPVDCGVNIPWIYYADACGLSPEPQSDYREGVKFVNLIWDAQAYLACRRAKQLSFLGWLRSFRGVKSFAILKWTDPLPFVFYLLKGIRVWKPFARLGQSASPADRTTPQKQ
jgi:D-aspartate ligase